MLREQRDELFYEYCDNFDVLNEDEYFIESEESIFYKVKKFFSEAVEKIRKFLFGEKVKKLDMNETVKVPVDTMKRTDGFINAFKKFASKVGKFIVDNKAISITLITTLTAFTISEAKRRKFAKDNFGTAKRSELQKRIEILDNGMRGILNEIDRRGADVGMRPIQTRRVKRMVLNEYELQRRGLKHASSTFSHAYATILSIGKVVTQVCTWLGNLLTAPLYIKQALR